MERRKTELKKTSEQDPGEQKNRFQFVRLEERIAPCSHLNPQGKDVGHDTRACDGGR